MLPPEMRYAWMPLGLLLSCSSTPDDLLPPPQAQLFVGQELDNWAVPPPATHVKIELVQSADGSRSTLTEGAAPAPNVVTATATPTTILLPEQHYTGFIVASFEVTATDAMGEPVVRGSTVPFQLDAIQQAVSVPIFVGRLGTWSRPPDLLEHPHLHPLVGVTLHEFVIAAGGDPVAGANTAVPDIYDGAAWLTLLGQPPLPRAPKSMVLVGSALLAVDDDGATWVNLSNDQTNVVTTLPDKLTSFSEIAGGDTITLPDGTRYIIGGTRPTGDPTDKVLRIDSQAAFRVITLGTPRLGAAATMIGTTIVVAGGTAAGPMAEVLTADELAFTPLSLPADPTAGLGLAPLDATTAVAAGGKDPGTGTAASVRTFDISCTASCATTDVATLPLALTRTKVFVVGPDKILATGESDDGENHAYLIDKSVSPSMVTEKPLREPRKGATPFSLPSGQAALLGGQRVDTGATAATIEAFIP